MMQNAKLVLNCLPKQNFMAIGLKSALVMTNASSQFMIIVVDESMQTTEWKPHTFH